MRRRARERGGLQREGGDQRQHPGRRHDVHEGQARAAESGARNDPLELRPVHFGRDDLGLHLRAKRAEALTFGCF